MNLLAELRQRFTQPLGAMLDQPADMLGMIRPSQDPRFGDYQANFAMPLAKRLNRPAREIAEELASQAALADCCEAPEVAGPGFINLRFRDDFLKARLAEAFADPRVGVSPVPQPLTMIVDFSSPNVAKPMHVGHIRSTVIGDCLSRVARFLGHRVITDNHLGDWGTQFGMIIYGYKHFRDDAAYREAPVGHLSQLYRRVRQLVDYHDAVRTLPGMVSDREAIERQLETLRGAPVPTEKDQKKKQQAESQRLANKLAALEESLTAQRQRIAAVDNDPALKELALQHARIGQQVLEETAKLHAGDAENVNLWNEFLPFCRKDIERIYKRLDVAFDQELGESFYHDQLENVVEDLRSKGLAKPSEGAVCVFLKGFETPMLIQKSDGAYLYATTDLATIKYRADTWRPDVVLYVVDHRQHEHFEKLFAAAAEWGYQQMDLRHVSFGTVLGDDGKPFKTRAGDTVGLEGLLDEAERRALAVLQGLQKEDGETRSAEENSRVAKVVGLGALKFADLSQHRASDYKFSYDKMLELRGFTATYLQYLYARVQGIFRHTDVDPSALRQTPSPFVWTEDVERQLAISLLRFPEALDDVLVDYRPNILAQYLFELAQLFFKFYDQCSVNKAESEALRVSRLQLCDLTARVVRTGLELMGIGVVDKM